MQSTEIKTESPKLTIATTIKELKSVAVEKSLSLPYYFKDLISNEVYKVVTQEHTLRIYNIKNWWGIKIIPTAMYHEEIAKGTPITSDEFEAAFSQAMMYVDLINRNEEPLREKDVNEEIDQIIERRAS